MGNEQRKVIGTYNYLGRDLESLQHFYRYLGRNLESLQHFYRIRIEVEESTETAFVIFCSDIHATRECQLPVSFRASQFSPMDILRDSDVQHQIFVRYGNVWRIN